MEFTSKAPGNTSSTDSAHPKKQFHVTPKKQVEVDMMFNSNKFRYGELPELNVEAVALLYKGGRLSMVIILPKEVDGLDKIQENIGTILQGVKSFVWDSLAKTYSMKVRLPFKVETTLGNLKDVLQRKELHKYLKQNVFLN